MIFRYPGGKSRKAVVEWILNHRPPEFDEYREAFVGGGGVFWRIPTSKKRWVNDLHPGLMAVYAALRDRPDAFIKACRQIPVEREREAFEFAKLNESVDPALRYLLVNRLAFGGRVNYDIPSRLYFSNAGGWRKAHSLAMEEAAYLLQGVTVTSYGYERLLTYSGQKVWVYLDPPYVKNTKLAKSSRLYQHSFEMADHVRLCEDVKKCPHQVAISYDDCPEIRRLYDGFRMVENSWTYCGTGEAEKLDGKELLILNY